MQTNFLTDIFLPLSLAIIMIGMGLSLTLADFQLILKNPKAVLIGLFCQLVLLPLTAFGLVAVWGLKPEFSVGILLIAAAPGGPTSNLLSYLGKCDAALSISLTALSSLITIFSLPFIVNYGMNLYMGQDQTVALPVLKTILQIMVITVIPVAIGMLLKAKQPGFAARAERPVKIASAVFIAIIIVGVILKDKENIVPAFTQAGFPALVINVVTLLTGFFIPKILGLNNKQCGTISIEAGIQNGTLAIAIATSSTLLNNPTIAIPAAVYSLIMFMTGFAAVSIFGRMNRQ